MMSVPAETYSFGFNMIFVVWAMVLAVPVLIYVIVPVFYDNNVSNCYEVSENVPNESAFLTKLSKQIKCSQK